MTQSWDNFWKSFQLFSKSLLGSEIHLLTWYWKLNKPSSKVWWICSMIPWSLWLSTFPLLILTSCFSISFVTSPMNSCPGSTLRTFGHFLVILSKESLEVSGSTSLSSFALRNFLLHKKGMACFPSFFLITSFPSWWNTLDSSHCYCSWQWNCLKTFWSWQRDCIFNLFVRGKGIGFFCSLLINMYGVDLSFSSTLLMPSVFCSSGSVRYEVFFMFFPFPWPEGWN